MASPANTNKGDSFPVLCSGPIGNYQISASITANKKDYYSLPFPDGYPKEKFRIKLKYMNTNNSSGNWLIYISYWKPLNFVDSPKTIHYKVVFCDYGGEVTVHQEYYNKWILICQRSASSFKFRICDIIDENVPPKLPPLPPNPLSSVLDGAQPASSIEITGCDSAKIEVLQCAIESCSEVFSLMLNGDWREKNEKRIHLKDLDQQALTEFKEYLYTFANPKSCAVQLFALANVYQMEHLKYTCALTLYDQLTPDNALSVLSVASQYRYAPLLNALWSYCEEHCQELRV